MNMKGLILNLVFYFFISLGFCQDQNDNVLYIVDTVPIFEEPKEGFGTISENEIDRVEVINDKELFKNKGFKDFDGLIYVYTKAYVQRPDSIKAIPTTNLMTKNNGTWYLKDKNTPYSGPFIDYYLNGVKQGEGTLFNGRLKGRRLMYHLNGVLSDDIEYENGFANGLEKRFYEDGTLKQQGSLLNGKENGIWELYHPNGKLKMRATFVFGNMDGEAITYYSTGEIKVKSHYNKGKYIEDKQYKKVFDSYQQGQEQFYSGNFKAAIKKYTKCIELDGNWVDGYFARGTAKMENFEFDEAIEDFTKAIEIEPLFTNAYANRGIAILRKHQLGNGRTLSKSKDVLIIASKETEIPTSELTKICADLKMAVSLGDDNWMVLEELDKHCKD